MINVNFGNCEKEKDISGLWQYDYGQILRIQGLDLPAAVEIHFSLQSRGGDSLTRVGVTKDAVTDVVIPDSMLENNYTADNYSIYVFIYLTDETSGQTEYKICMRVRSRPRPEAFDKPEDAELFREAIAAVNEAVGRAGVSEEKLQEMVNVYLKENPINGGMTEEQIAQLCENTVNISRLSDVIANMPGGDIVAPATAEVGQALVVKAVDENGKPTEWETKIITGGDVDVDAELKEYYTTAKSNIRSSLEQKGVAVEDTDSLNDYATLILEIPSAVNPTETIPAQTVLSAQGLQETLGIKLNWKDVDAAGYLIVRKENLAPESTADGTTVFRGTGTEYTDEDVSRGVVYYYRIFPYNDLSQYQAVEDGSVAMVDYVDRSGQVAIADLAVGDTIKFGEYDGALYTWKVVDNQEKDQGFVTMCADQNLGTMAFDEKENASANPNPVTARTTGGNNRWLYSNARQILNSDAAKGEWYSPQHDYDVAPGYATSKNGFLKDFTDYEKEIIVQKTNKCVLDTNDGGGSETMIDKIWLPSTYAMGLEVTLRPLEDDVVYEYFDSNEKRSYTSNYWTRTINGTTSASGVRYVVSSGSLYSYAANSSNALRPFCLLPTSAYVRWSDSDGAYILADDSQRNA